MSALDPSNTEAERAVLHDYLDTHLLPPLVDICWGYYHQEWVFASNSPLLSITNDGRTVTLPPSHPQGFHVAMTRRALPPTGRHLIRFVVESGTATQLLGVMLPSGATDGFSSESCRGWCYCDNGMLMPRASRLYNSTEFGAWPTLAGDRWLTTDRAVVTMEVDFEADTISFAVNAKPMRAAFAACGLKTAGPLFPAVEMGGFRYDIHASISIQ